MKYLMQYLKERKGKVTLTLALLLGQAVGTLFIPFLIANIVDNGILKGDMNKILQIGGLMLVVLLITTAIATFGSFYSADLAAELGYEMRDKLLRKSQQLSVHDFDSIGVSSMITRSTSDISTIQQTFGLVLQLIVPAPFLIVSSIIMTSRASAKLSIVLITSIIVFVIFAGLIINKSVVISTRVQKKLDQINKVVRENITGIRVIRAFGNEGYEKNRASDSFKGYATDMITLNKLFAGLNPIIWAIMGLSMVVMLWLGGVLSIEGTMELGQITAVIEYSIITLSYLILATSTSVTLPKMISCFNRIEEVLEIHPGIQDGTIKNEATTSNGPVLEFDNVSFYYKGAEEPVINKLSFACHAGETVAIIGSTGAGKSTIANLVLRLHDIDHGKISINGLNIKDLPQNDLRNKVGYVPQKALLFSGTIESNLMMGNKKATSDDIKRALSVSQSQGFVEKLQEGTNALVAQGGTNFSGGQKQRLAIARALMRKAPIYIFDDSFSALDLKTDSALRKALKENMKDAVKLIIAQRVSTIMDADKILVLDQGELVGLGKHQELLENCSVYQAIAKSQMNI
ncbi:MAG: ABC transporter ATP-binding protein [Cellulosilyticaceae bacterium]